MSEPVRLQKYLADLGVASRRAIELMITEGRITVDGAPASLGQKVVPGEARIVVDGRGVGRRGTPQRVVLAIYKPRGVLCTNSDPHGGETVFDLVPPPHNRERLFCAGRLDKDSEGLVILTNDGTLSQRLTHPSNRVIKRYEVELDSAFDPRHVRTLLNGVTWEGERLQAEKVIVRDEHAGPEGARRLEIHLDHGRKREIRRLLAAVGYRVKRLKRFQIGDFNLRGMSAGRVKELGPKDIERLFATAE